MKTIPEKIIVGGDMVAETYDPSNRQSEVAFEADVENNLTSTETTHMLSAAQGKILKDSADMLKASSSGNGVVSGMVLSINSDNTKFDLSSGVFCCTDGDDKVFAGESAVVLTYLATHLVTYIGVHKTTNAIYQQTSPFTAEQRRTYVLIGAVIHSNNTNINAINNLPDVAVYGLAQYNDLLDGIGAFNREGNAISANGANLFINKSVGNLFKRGVNYTTDPLNPHVKVLDALVAPTNIRYRLSDSTEYGDTQEISKFYESTPGVRTALPNTKFTIQRVAIFSSNLIRIQYGQAVYLSMSKALQAVHTEEFTYEANIAENGLLLCYIIFKGSVTELNDTDKAVFIGLDKFGQIPIGGGAGTTNLQQGYENSVIPQITTDTTLGALSIKRGSDADTDKVLDIINGSDVSTASITGDGRILKQGVYAEIYCNDNVTPQDIPTGDTYTKLTGFTDDGLSKNATPDVANDKITITKAGIYRIAGSISMYCDIDNALFTIALFLDGVEQTNIKFKKKLATGADVGDDGLTGFLSADSVPVDIDVRAKHDNVGTVALTMDSANLNIEYIGEI